MALKRVTSSRITDSKTRTSYNELVCLITDSQGWEIEHALSFHNQSDSYMSEPLKHNQSFYSQPELEFFNHIYGKAVDTI